MKHKFVSLLNIKENIQERSSNLGELALKLTEKNGGLTISLDGDVPLKGFVFTENTELAASIPKEAITENLIIDYIIKNFDELIDINKYLGIWVHDNEIILDIVSITEERDVAVRKGKDANQKAIFDLDKFEEITI